MKLFPKNENLIANNGIYSRGSFTLWKRNEDMFKSNTANPIVRISGLWIVYFLVFFTNDTFSYSHSKSFFLIATGFYLLMTGFLLWRIKNPGKNTRYSENEG